MFDVPSHYYQSQILYWVGVAKRTFWLDSSAQCLHSFTGGAPWGGASSTASGAAEAELSGREAALPTSLSLLSLSLLSLSILSLISFSFRRSCLHCSRVKGIGVCGRRLIQKNYLELSDEVILLQEISLDRHCMGEVFPVAIFLDKPNLQECKSLCSDR